jgi:CRISP-associated protein Cas1
MIKRTLYFGNPGYLNLKDGQLVLRLPENDKTESTATDVKKSPAVTVPVEDIGVVLLDNPQITITQGLMAALTDNNVAIITCDAMHHPAGLLLPMNGNTLQSERFRTQINAGEPLKKQLWAQTIVQKIKNQAVVLESTGASASYLTQLAAKVRSGDADNCEATAAAYYWSHLFPEDPDFKREREGFAPNNYFNYAYAVLRATMARSVVAAGLLPTLGIHHTNKYNAYCLADDLMEPYRPYADTTALAIIKEHGLQDDLTKPIKAALLQLLGKDVMMKGEKSPLMVATQRTAVSLVKCFAGELKKIHYPEML